MKIVTKSIGDFGEDAACRFFEKDGYRITERNYRASHKEIDIIVENETEIVFVEVKTRSVRTVGGSFYGRPASAVDYKKRQNLIYAAQTFLRTHKINKSPRIDVVEVYLKENTDGGEPEILKLKHIRNAVTR